jgi:hypothetical protein
MLRALEAHMIGIGQVIPNEMSASCSMIQVVVFTKHRPDSHLQRGRLYIRVNSGSACSRCFTPACQFDDVHENAIDPVSDVGHLEEYLTDLPCLGIIHSSEVGETAQEPRLSLPRVPNK